MDSLKWHLLVKVFKQFAPLAREVNFYPRVIAEMANSLYSMKPYEKEEQKKCDK